MKAIFLYICLLCSSPVCLLAQTAASKLQRAFKQFEADAQLKYALISFYVIEAKTGNVVFEKNSRIGLAPASTQKIITSATAFALLGKDFRYKTSFGITEVNGAKAIYIRPSGDPTLGSWRWNETGEKKVMGRLYDVISKRKIKPELVLLDSTGWTDQYTPDGWIWQDIGNYYGAGALGLNWRENQYDLVLRSGDKPGDAVDIVTTVPRLYSGTPVLRLKTGPRGSGDNAYIYPFSLSAMEVRGTIPAGEKKFVISGSFINPMLEFTGTLMDTLSRQKITIAERYFRLTGNYSAETIHTEISPPLDSIVYWFNKKSINLYGEALLKTLAYEKAKQGYSKEGVKIIRAFWKDQGVEEDELNMVDGSGLSPLNRVTTHAQVSILRYAKSQPWFNAFYASLPEYNGMKMKSGTINGVKGFCGYHHSKDGKEYIFSFLVNNYNGSASALLSKMYRVLEGVK